MNAPAHPHNPMEPDQQQLQALRDAQQALARGISHDLRAPLRAIDGFARHLQDSAATGLDADTAQAQLQRIRNAAGRMGGLIDQLLEYLRAGSVERNPGPVDISMLAEWSGAELCDAHPGRSASIHVAAGLSAWGDERQYKVLFDQVLRNAWRFSQGRDEVRIAVAGRREGDMLHLSVTDHGSGFDPAQDERVFEPFQRMHAEADGGGHGLGLAIARAIVEREGGRIRAEAAPDAGCTIHMELPVREAIAASG